MNKNNDYVIFTDSSCDLSEAKLAEWGISYASLTFRFPDVDREYANNEMSTRDFYQKMREGGVAKTSAVSVGVFEKEFESLLKNGLNVLYLGFSSGLSTTYNSARVAADRLREKYPERRIITVDTLCASAGVALLIDLVIKKKKAGATIDEAATAAEAAKLNVCHMFTVDDLVYLKRGGRVSSATALVGNILSIKPVMHVDNEGHLVAINKVRGRKNAINALADRLCDMIFEDSPIFISHGDCEGEAKILSGIIEAKIGRSAELITDVGPVIGAHSGPGTLALFFFGKER